ncbi:MAG: hypothetical protein QW568_04565 [Candidatus Anstonellaceae archaeon]
MARSTESASDSRRDGLLITTGKNAAKISKRLAAELSLAIPHSRFEARGKRTMEKLLALATKRHYSRLCTISEENGKPATMSFLSIGMNGEWSRLSPTIRITSLKFASPKQIRNPRSSAMLLSGTKKKTLQSLFGLEGDDEGKHESEISSSATMMQVRLSGKKILTLGAKYAK